MEKKTNPRKDFTQTAFNVFQQAIGEAEAEEELTGKKADSQKGNAALTVKGAPQEASKIKTEINEQKNN